MVTLNGASHVFSRVFSFAKRHWAEGAISVSACLIFLAIYISLYIVRSYNPFLDLFADIELKTLDMRFQLRGQRLPGPAVVIVAIDQRSLDSLGRWPFPRSVFARTVDYLRESQARVIAFDINFPQPDQNSALQALREIRSQYDEFHKGGLRVAEFEARLKTLEAGADNDKLFAEAIQRSQNVVLAWFTLTQEETRNQDAQRVSDFVSFLQSQSYGQIIHPEFARRFDGPEAQSLSPVLGDFAAHAKNFGFIDIYPDSDGAVRREPAVVLYKGGYYPSLDVAAALTYTGLSRSQARITFNRSGLEKIDLGPVRIPTDPAGLACIDFLGPSHTFPTYSLSDVVLRKLPSAIFKDKLVLIGPTAVGMRDAVMTPFQKAGYPGVEVHATFIDDLLYNHFIRRGIRENLFDLAFILLFTLGAGALLCAVPPARATVILLMLLGIFLWLSYYLFAAHGIWIVASLPVAALAASFGGIVCYRIFVEDWEKRNVRRAFTQYVPRKLISQVMQRSEPLRLGGEEKELTVLFSSVREFTAISESLSLSSLHEILNEYLSEMTDVVFKHGGTLDKFMGDGIMAFWGAPYPQADHAARACRAALEMQQSLPKLQSRWEAQGRPHIEIGVGINTGAVLVGNMGSRRRFNYTVVGASVNLAARLERITNTYGTHLIIGENTYEAVRNEMLARELDLIHVKGRPKPVRIFELLGTRAEADQHRDRIDRFARGLEAYRQEKWTAALAIFEALAADYPQDGPSRFFIERCRALLAQSGVGPGTPPA